MHECRVTFRLFRYLFAGSQQQPWEHFLILSYMYICVFLSFCSLQGFSLLICFSLDITTCDATWVLLSGRYRALVRIVGKWMALM